MPPSIGRAKVPLSLMRPPCPPLPVCRYSASLRPGILCFLATAGCSLRGAPSFPIVGAYFPDWMLCGLIGIATTIGLRVLFLLTGVDTVLSFRLFTYVALGVVAALTVWTLVFGP
ncbi:YtcA family lipoprotein [Gluconobacter kanchanaburiensis]|nr:YtcA family lipoprotein [Gluconobacter kanchanaburiensis]